MTLIVNWLGPKLNSNCASSRDRTALRHPARCLLASGRNKEGKTGSDSNGIKLSSNTLLFQGVTGCLRRFREKRIRLWPAFPGTGLDTVRSVGMDHRGQGVPWARGAAPPHGIATADPLQGHALPLRRCQPDHADQIGDQGKDG